MRRTLSVLLLPWVSIFFICLVASWYSLFVIGIDALLAPVMKLCLLLKPLLFKSLPALLLWLWTHTGAKCIAWLSELAALISTILGGWKAWSAKKMARHIGRFLLSLSARFVAVSVLFNLLFVHERRGIRFLPRFAMYRLRKTWLGHLLRWWKQRTERQKRLTLGIVLCVALVFAGQTMLGVSVLLFDLAWELVLLLWRLSHHVWRLIGPLLLKLVPNFIGNFVTQTLLPLIADVVPIIRDDHRVIYLRLNIRRHIRRVKAWLYIRSRARRHSVRQRITPLIADTIRKRKAELLHAAASFDSNDNRNSAHEDPPDTDSHESVR